MEGKKSPGAALVMLGVLAMLFLGGGVIGIRAVVRAGKKKSAPEDETAEEEDAEHVATGMVPPKPAQQSRPAKPADDDSGGVAPMSERPELTLRTPPTPPAAPASGGGGGSNALVPRAALEQMRAEFEVMLRSAVDNALAAQRSEYDVLLRRQADQIEKMGTLLTEAAQAIEFARSVPSLASPAPDYGADRTATDEAGPGPGDNVPPPAAGGNSGY